MDNNRQLATRVIIVLFYLFIPSMVQAQVELILKPYKVEKELANVVNLKDVKNAIEHYTGKKFSFTDEQKEMIIKNGFVVSPSEAEQFFHVYESSHFGITPRIPNFITSDAVLQLYHLFYDFTLRAIEVDYLLPSIRKLTQAMLEESKKQYANITNPTLKDACLKNTSFFGVAANLLGMENISLPENSISEIKNELLKIAKHEGREHSSIFPFQHDYSQYIPRGHYTRSEELKKFFLVMMWYGQNSFPFEFEGKRMEQQILQALLITHSLINSKRENELIINLWDKVYSITALYVGSTDDLNVYHFKELMKEVYGEDTALEILPDKERLNIIYETSEKLPHPKIVTQLVGIPSGLQFRFMGQRFIPDSYIMQELVNWPQRPWPKGLDVMAVLGSERAENILDTIYEEPKKWEKYLSRRQELKQEFMSLAEEKWYQNLFYGWLYVLQSLLDEKGQGYPIFMQNNAWVDKELNTTLASWAELRHDTILYGKPSGAEGGNEEEKIPQPKGYVEPLPEFYGRLLRLMRLNKQLLSNKGYDSEKIKQVADQYEGLLLFLEDISQKELIDRPLKYEEYERIRRFGSEIEALSIAILELGSNDKLRGWFEVTGADSDIACIADVHTSGADCLEEAVGHINLIYVIVPIEGKLHLTRGGVFTYYEFQYPAAHRLTDEAWQEMIKRGRAPKTPSWTSSFIVE